MTAASSGPGKFARAVCFFFQNYLKLSSSFLESLSRSDVSSVRAKESITARRHPYQGAIPVANIRIGAVEYLNTKPLICDLDLLAPDAELRLETPSRLAVELAEDRLDVALI